MKLDAFYNMYTLEDVKNRIQLTVCMAEEKGLNVMDMLRITGTPYNELRYVLSTIKGNCVYSHFFTYTDKETGLKGLCELPSSKTKLVKYCNPSYIKFTSIHPLMWLCLRSDLTYDIIINGKVRARGIKDFDTLMLGNGICFLQLDYSTKTSLICIDIFDYSDGIYCVQSQEDFDRWFHDTVSKKGYNGELDSVPISQLYNIYFDVINTIFVLSNFAPIKLNGLKGE